MRLVEIRLKMDYVPTPEEMAQLQAAHIYGPKFESDKEGKMPYWNHYLVDIDKMPLIPHDVERVVFTTAPFGLDVDTAGRVPVINQKVNVQVPGLGLLLLDEVQVETNCCTENLNSLLKEGWRIVAVCPQPDQRRPDYVLGRVRQKEI